MSQLNNTFILRADHQTNMCDSVVGCTTEQKSPRVPIQHEKVLAMLDNCDGHTSLLSRMENLRQYFPLTLTIMTEDTKESLLLSAKASSYTGTSSSSGSNNLTAATSLSGMMKKSASQARASSLVDIYQDVTELISTPREVSIGNNNNESTDISINKKLSSSFHVSDANYCAHMGPLSNSLTDNMKSGSHSQTSNQKIDGHIDFMSGTDVKYNKSVQTPTLVRFTLGTDKLSILPEYEKESSIRKELLRRPGKNILSLLSDKVYMGDPYHLLVLVRNTSQSSSLKYLLSQTSMPPDTRLFPCYWEGTVENRTTARTVVSINGYRLKLIVPLSPSIYEKFTQSFDPVCSARFNRTAQLISNAAYYTRIWRLKTIESISKTDKNNENVDNKCFDTVVVSQVAERLFLCASRAASIALSKHSSLLNPSNQQDIHSDYDIDMQNSNTDVQSSPHLSNQSPFIEQVSNASTSSIVSEQQNSMSNAPQSEQSPILNFSTISPDSLSPLVVLASAPIPASSTSDHAAPANLDELFRKPLRSTDCLKKQSFRQLSQIAHNNSQSFTTIHSPSQPLAASSLGPSLLSSAVALPTLKSGHRKPDSTNRYAKRRDHMFKVAYGMGLSRKT